MKARPSYAVLSLVTACCLGCGGGGSGATSPTVPSTSPTPIPWSGNWSGTATDGSRVNFVVDSAGRVTSFDMSITLARDNISCPFVFANFFFGSDGGGAFADGIPRQPAIVRETSAFVVPITTEYNTAAPYIWTTRAYGSFDSGSSAHGSADGVKLYSLKCGSSNSRTSNQVIVPVPEWRASRSN